MSARPVTLILAAGLLILIGVSGIAAAAELVGIATGGGSSVPGVEPLTILIAAALGAYGCGLVLAGIALLLLRRWAWWLGVALIAVGVMALLAPMLVNRSVDQVLSLGVATWGATLVLLLVPDTRRATGR
jgi:hypothetical protein